MKAKRYEIFTLLRMGFKKTEISKQLNVSRTSILWVEQRLKGSEFQKDSPQSGRSQVISQEAFENDPCHKMARSST